jgi:hypothetical protein
LPSLVPVIVAVPALTGVTSPLAGSTVATPVLSELHATARPGRRDPLPSLVMALACAVSTAVIVLGVRVTATVATGIGVTVRVALPLLPSLVAVIWVVPATTAVTSPEAETVATAVLLELHVTTRPLNAPPLPSNVVAVACVV